MNEAENIINESANQGERFKRKFRASKLLLIPYIIFCGVVFSNALWIIETTDWIGNGSIESKVCVFLEERGSEMFHFPYSMQFTQGFFVLAVFY